jgi:hypothetical protein
VWRAFVVVLGVTLAAGCGGSPQTPNTATQLTIKARIGVATATLRPAGATLRCDGTAFATGYLRHTANRACALVHRGAIQRVANNQRSRRVCSQIYGGPQSAHIKGTINAEPVNLTVTRTDGCGTADWQTLEALLGYPQR